ncbi:MAG: hypothetical protein ACREHE_00365 [Rhizomicrobium sp.]
MARTKTGKTRATKRRAATARRKPKTRKPKTRKPKTRKIAGRKAKARKAGSRKPAARKTKTRKAAAASKVKARRKTAARSGGDVMGEGNYSASRRFRKKETAFVRRNRGRIAKMGEAAEAALDGAEGGQLRAAESEAAGHAHLPAGE